MTKRKIFERTFGERRKRIYTVVCEQDTGPSRLSKRTVHLMVEDEVRLLAWFSKLVLILKTSTRDIIAKYQGLFPRQAQVFLRFRLFQNPQANHLAAKIKCPLFCVSTLLIQFIQCFYKIVQWQQFHLSA